MQFARARKLKEKDVRDFISGLKYAKANSGCNVVTEGQTAEYYYIVVDGRCSSWSPIQHAEAYTIVSKYLEQLE